MPSSMASLLRSPSLDFASNPPCLRKPSASTPLMPMVDQRSYPQSHSPRESRKQHEQPHHQRRSHSSQQTMDGGQYSHHHRHLRHPGDYHSPITIEPTEINGSSNHTLSTRYLGQNQHYQGHRQMLEDDDEDGDDNEDDDDDDDEEDQHGLRSVSHSAYNSAYSSCDESEDVNMEGVAIKEDSLDHDMADPPSSGTPSFARHPNIPSRAHQPQHPQQYPFHPQRQQQQQQQLHHHQQYHHDSQTPQLPASSSPSSSTATPASSPPFHSKAASSMATPFANIKPRPALRPLLPSRPTSPQPLAISRSGTQSSEVDDSKDSLSNNAHSASKTNTIGRKRQSAYRINGLNILNRNSLDSRTALEMIRRRRENHNHVERRRRDTLNSTILQIADILPNCSSTAKLNKGTILRLALDHLQALHTENHSLRSENAALRFFYQGSQSRRNGPQGPGSVQGQPGTLPPQPPHTGARAGASSSSGTSTPQIIPGPGQGTIPGLAASAAQVQPPAQFGTNPKLGSVAGSVPGSAANSPPGQHSTHLGPSSVTSSSASSASSASTAPNGHSANNRSMSTSGHLHPIMPKPQPSKASPSSSPRPRLLPHPSPSSIKPYYDIRLGPSPLSSPCSSPPLAHMVSNPALSTNSNAFASALPTVAASHQHSAAVSAAAAAAAAAATAGSGLSGQGHTSSSRTPVPSSTSSSMAARHQKSNSGGILSSDRGLQHAPLSVVASGPGSGSERGRKHSSHSSHSSISSAPSSGTPSAASSPYGSPFPGYIQGGQRSGSPSSHPLYPAQHHHSSLPQYPQHQQHAHPPQHYPQGSGVVLPSIGSMTDASSPMTSPHHGPHQMAPLALPTPLSLPGPAHEFFGKQQQHYSHPSQNQGPQSHGPPHLHAHATNPRVHPHDRLNILPPLAPR